MSDLRNMANQAIHDMVSGPPATPPHSTHSTRAASMDSPAPAVSGLLTPPPSTLKHGKTKHSSAMSPSGSIPIEFGDDLDCLPPTQPNIASPASAAPVPSDKITIQPVVVASSTPRNPFEALAMETIQHIAGYVDSDQDLTRFIRSCKDVNISIEDASNSFWRCRFKSKFEIGRNADAKKWSNNLEYKKLYQHRRRLLRKGAVFKLGKTGPERMCLFILRDLINDSFSQQKSLVAKFPNLVYEDRNLAAVVQFCKNENILWGLLDPRNAHKRHAIGTRVPYEPLLQTIQAIMTPLILCNLGPQGSDFPTSQISAYSPATKQPMFTGCCGGTVNMDWLLHQTNFWKYHFTREAESTLFTDIDALDKAEYPKLWNSQLSQKEMPALGKKWKGISAFLRLNEMTEMRDDDPRDDIMDEFSGSESGGAIQDLSLEMCLHDTTPAESTRIFTAVLDAHLPKKRAKTRSDQQDDAPLSDPRTFRMGNMSGGCKDGQWIGDGWLTPLPSQSGIPGWQRVSMMKYWKDSNNQINDLTLWAYEGVMLPGGRTIIGRWWSPDENGNTDQQYSGPFIMWHTE